MTRPGGGAGDGRGLSRRRGRINPFLLPVAGVIAIGAVYLLATLAVLAVLTPVSVAVGLVPTVGIPAAVWWLLSHSRMWPAGGAGAAPLVPVLWGAVGVFVLVGPTGSAWSDLTQYWGWDAVVYSLAGAWPEETCKAAGVVCALQLGRRVWDRPGHGVIVGALVGLGFEMVEDLVYGAFGAVEHPTSDLSGVLGMWGTRLAAGPGLHALWTMVAGFGIGLALLSPGVPAGRRIGRAAGGLGAAFLLHALWNISWPASWPAAVPVVWMVLVYLVSAAAAALVWWRSSRRIPTVAPQLGLM